MTLDRGASEKFLSLIQHTLGCLEIILTPNKVVNAESIFEELLQYLGAVFVLDAETTVKVVFQVYKNVYLIFIFSNLPVLGVFIYCMRSDVLLLHDFDISVIEISTVNFSN